MYNSMSFVTIKKPKLQFMREVHHVLHTDSAVDSCFQCGYNSIFVRTLRLFLSVFSAQSERCEKCVKIRQKINR